MAEHAKIVPVPKCPKCGKDLTPYSICFCCGGRLEPQGLACGDLLCRNFVERLCGKCVARFACESSVASEEGMNGDV